jgi:protein tyrosine phosphatase (PTP) superfamily phosphohydrolase (DUF442 family)
MFKGSGMRVSRLLLGLAILTSGGAEASELADISAYMEYSPVFSSSGQPTAEQLKSLKAEGFQRVVYIAFTDQDSAVRAEDRLVKDLGMDYLQVPVDWNAPGNSDFYLFADAMQRASGKRTLLHCQANYRASAFAFLYRVLYDDVPMAVAKRDMNKIWKPNDRWRKLIFDILEENGKSPYCEDCEW